MDHPPGVFQVDLDLAQEFRRGRPLDHPMVESETEGYQGRSEGGASYDNHIVLIFTSQPHQTVRAVLLHTAFK